MLYAYYVEYNTAPSCAEDLFQELISIDDDIPDSDAAAALCAIGMWTLLV